MSTSVPPRAAVGTAAVIVAFAGWITLAWLGVTAPARTHPLVYFGLIFLGAGSFTLLLTGAGALTARSRSLAGQLTPSFVAGVRTLVLAMWLCAIVTDVLGCLIIFGTGGRGGTAPLTPGLLLVPLAVTAVTVGIAWMTAFSVRSAHRH